MKIFYVTSTEFYRKYPKKYASNIKLIEKLSGEKVSHFTNRQSQEFDYDTEQEEVTQLIKNIEHELKDADALIADITISSAGPGYDIATALGLKKPVLVLKHESDTSKRGPHSITIKKNQLLNYIKYNDTNFEKVLKDFLVQAEGKLDTKFILIIPAKIDQYLEWSSSYKRMHKAQLVREAIEKYMDKDEDWKEFVDDNEII